MLTVALDDPVPADSAVAVVEPDYCRAPPHQVESEVRRTLLAEPELSFASLVVRRVPDGVCLEGVLETGNDAPDVCRLARTVLGVERVINHLLVRSRLPLPRKKR
jgi:osmotically-inducible protein OsmY